MIPKAYDRSDEHAHYICAWCPDKKEAEALARNVEWKKQIDALIEGVIDYQKRCISHTICQQCADNMRQDYEPRI